MGMTGEAITGCYQQDFSPLATDQSLIDLGLYRHNISSDYCHSSLSLTQGYSVLIPLLALLYTLFIIIHFILGRTAPNTFTKLTKQIVPILMKLGIQFSLYLSNMLIVLTTQERARKLFAAGLELLVTLWFVVNTKKTLSLEFLDSQQRNISLPPEKLKSAAERLSQINSFDLSAASLA